MAVNTGVALVSVDARPREGEAIPAGGVVNTAQRILAGTSFDGILVGEQTYRATRDAIEYRAVARWRGGASRSRSRLGKRLRRTRRPASESATSRGRRSSDGSASSICSSRRLHG